MSDILQAIGQAMRNDAETLRVIGQNIANAETVAYRRQIPVARAQFDAALGDAQQALGAVALPSTEVAFDRSAGTLKSTGIPLHIALDGSGYFVVRGASGELLTRRGDLHVASDGLLVNAQGDAVLGEQGPIHIGSAVPSITADGNVSVDGAVVDRLRIATLTPGAALQPIGDGRYGFALDAIEENDSRPTVRQGFLETSNVVPMNEMIQLLDTYRRFEAEQRFVRAYDDVLGKAISKLGKVD